MSKYAVATFDFVYREIIKKVSKHISFDEAKELAKKHALNWAEDEGVNFWNVSSDRGDILCVCSPLSDYGCVVVPVIPKVKESV